MDVKVLIICLSLCGLLYGAIGSDDAPSSSSKSNVDSEKGSEQHFEVDADVRQETAHEPSTIETLSAGAENETQAPTLEDVIHGRIGDLKVYRDSPSSLDITWTIPNFFTRSYEPDSGILSPDFLTLGFKGFIVMDPKGSTTTPGVLQFRSVVQERHNVPRGNISFRLYLKKANGKFVEFMVKEEFRNFYTCNIPKHKIFEEKDIMAPKGVLTVLFKLTADKGIPDISERLGNTFL